MQQTLNFETPNEPVFNRTQMKKYCAVLSLTFFSLIAEGQYFADNWSAGGGALTATNAWTTNTTDVLYNWNTSDVGSTGDFYAYMNNFASGSHAVTAWLITPAIDLSGATTPVLNFQNTWNFTGDMLELFICTDYTGGDPATDGSWTDHTADATWSAGSFAWTNSGDIDLSAYMVSTVYIGFKYTGTAVDGSKWEIDDFAVEEPGASTGDVSIYDIQYSTASPAVSSYLGDIVTTRGVVTGIVLNGPDAGAYFLQDGGGAWNGLYIYDTDAVVAIGDSILLTGEVDEFNLGVLPDGVTELKNISAYTVLNSLNTLPTASDVSSLAANDEEWEGVLIRVPSGEVTNTTEGFGLWSLDDGSGVIKGDDEIFAFHLTAVVGSWYDVTGIGHYSFDEAKLLPRDILDIIQTGWASLDETENILLYPNPANDVISVSNASGMNIQILNHVGQVFYSGVCGSTLDVSFLAAGNYVVVLANQDRTTFCRLVIQ